MAKVNLYLEKVIVKVANATDESLNKIAQQISGYAKRNIRENEQIDTGYLMSSIYAVSQVGGSGYAAALAEARTKTQSSKTGKTVDVSRRMAREERLPKSASAAVVVGANYAIYQELVKPFLYPAAEQGARDGGGIVEATFRERLTD